MMCPTFLLKFLRSFFQKATVTPLLTCLFNSNGNTGGHTDHGVVTCADESHHLYVKSACGGFRGAGYEEIQCF